MKTLVILAAGLGSRFGGDKQLAEFGAPKLTLMEYNLRAAFNAGFNHVVFVIRSSLEVALKQRILPRLPIEINVDIVLQTLEELPSDCSLPLSRSKPLGTAHAVWCCRHLLHSSFAVINADDYYGKQAFRLLVQKASTRSSEHLMVSYQLDKTLSPFGGVNRGICNIDEDGQLVSVEEYENIAENSDNIFGTSHKTNQTIQLSPESPASMNCWYLNPDIFPLLETEIRHVLSDEQSNTEAFLPNVIMKQINMFGKQVIVVKSSERWFGVTYPEDVALVNDKINTLFEEPDYLFTKEIKQVISKYGFNSSQAKLEPLGDGHINQTYKLVVDNQAFVLQKINHQIFTSPRDLIENTQSINQHLLEKIQTGTYQMKVPLQILSNARKLFVMSNGYYWRLMEFVPDSYTVAQVTSITQAKQVAQAFASYNNALQSFSTKKLNIIIKDFHNLDVRLEQLNEAIEYNTHGRLSNCRETINNFLSQKIFITQIAKIIPKLPVRVTHNDTKINNLLFLNLTEQPCAVIDLDTSMPGYLMHDFGDMVRTCCSNLAEDDPNINKMVFKREIFDTLLVNYSQGFTHSLSEIEKESLQLGARLLPFIIGSRFLTDYLNGDRYFNTTRENQNLDRAKNQFRLFELTSV